MKKILKIAAAVTSAVMLTAAAMPVGIQVFAWSDTSDSYLDYNETDVIGFETAEEENLYRSEEDYLLFRPNTTKGVAAVSAVDPDDSANKAILLKNLNYTDGSENKGNGNHWSASISVGDVKTENFQRFGMKFKCNSNTSGFNIFLNKKENKQIAQFSLDATGDKMSASHWAVTQKKNVKTSTSSLKNVRDGKWHTLEAFLHSGDAGDSDGYKGVEIYVDGVRYLTYDTILDSCLNTITVYSTGVTGEDGVYLDDITFGKLEDEFYATAEYDKENQTVNLTYNQYPSYSVFTSVNSITIDGVTLNSRTESGRKVSLKTSSPLECGKVYRLNLPNGLKSVSGTNIKNKLVEFEVPPDLPGEMSLTCSKTGRIFTDEDIKNKNLQFKIKLKNTAYESKKIKYKATVTTDSGEVAVQKNEVTLNLAAGVSAERTITLTDSDLSDMSRRYGRFFITVSAKADGDETYKSVSKMFTIIYSNGFVNEKVGTSSHYTRGKIGGDKQADVYGVLPQNMNNLSEVLNLHKIAGFGVIRDDVFEYGGYQNSFVPDERHKKMYSQTKDDEIQFMQLVLNSYYKKDGWFLWGSSSLNGLHKMPLTDAELAQFKKMNKIYAQVDKESHLYELTNEWNYIWNTKDDLYELQNGKEVLEKKDFVYTVDAYVKMIKAAADGIREGDPQAKIYAVCASKDYMVEFVKACFDAGIGNLIDGVSIHPYSMGVAPEIGHSESGKTTPTRDRILEVRQVLTDHGYPNMPIFISEMGWSSSPQTETDEESQAQFTIRALGLLEDLTEEISFYEAQEHRRSDGDSPEEHFGLLYENSGSGNALGAKPAYTALSCFNSLTADKTRVDGVVTDNNGNMYCTYENSAEKVIMYWNPDSDNVAVSISGEAESATVRDMYGNILNQDVAASNGNYNLTAGKSPKYLILNKNIDKGLHITNMYFKADGRKVQEDFSEKFKSMSDVKFNLKTSFKNTADAKQSVTVVLAVYGSDGRLKEASVKTYEVSHNESLMPRDIPTVTADGTDTVKGFLWDLRTQTPLCNALGV